MQKIISIVLPTFNRVRYLEETLGHFKDQLERNIESVEMIVCNNASTDNTDRMLGDYNNSNSFFKYLNFKEYVSIGLSIKRAISSATGKYVLLWGDDDFPSPLMIDTLLYYINKYPDVGLIHFNRLYGYDKNPKSICDLKVLNNIFSDDSIEYKELSEFIRLYYLDTSFLSSVLFKLSCWTNGCEIDSSKHYGYEFLFPIYYGLKKESLIYINFPLLIQRKPIDRSWINRSAYYRFIGLPNLLDDFQKYGLIEDAENIWTKEANSVFSFVSIILHASSDKKFYRPLIKEINSHQYNLVRKIFVYIIVYIFPYSLYEAIRKYFFTKKRK